VCYPLEARPRVTDMPLTSKGGNLLHAQFDRRERVPCDWGKLVSLSPARGRGRTSRPGLSLAHFRRAVGFSSFGCHTRGSCGTVEGVSSDATGVAEFERLFAEYEVRLGRFLVQIVGSRALAEDLLQETFLSALREDLTSVDNVGAWLYGVARNRALHALRTRRRAQSAFERLKGSRESFVVPDPAEAVAVRDLLERSLEVDDRVILVLRYVHGFDGPELAQIFDVSAEAARQRLSRARRRLLDALQERTELSAAEWQAGAKTAAPAEFRGQAGASLQTETRRIQALLEPLAGIAPVVLPRSFVARARRRHDGMLRRLFALLARG